MAGVNKVFLIGIVNEEPVFRKLEEGIQILSFSLLTEELIKKGGGVVDNKQYHKILIRNSLAQSAVNVLKKGTMVNIEGRLETQPFNSNGINIWKTEIIVTHFKLIGRPSDFRHPLFG